MAGLLDSVAGILLGKITQVAGQPETSPIRSELIKLEMTVSSLKHVLRDAEEKQANDSTTLTPLLQELQHAFSQADDLIEELECDYLKLRVQNQRNDVGKKVCHIFSRSTPDFIVSASKIADEINQINGKLVEIEKRLSEIPLVEEENDHIKRLKSEMTLRASITGSQLFSRLLRSKKEAILSGKKDSIVGRKEAKKSIIDKLLNQGDFDKQQSPAILSIHGSGGMGKTTLAKLVYNADPVFEYFDKRMWVCVSEDFDVQRIRRELLSSATGEQVSDALTDRHLQIRLQRNLVGRKFLLILDDFGALDSSRESELEKILKMGANGSKIIITTRSEQTLNDAATHKIEKLENKSMDLFKQALGNKKLAKNLPDVAEELVSKCGGVPLAIKCLARLLSLGTRDAAEWANVKDLNEKLRPEEMKDGCILPALRLSYDLMPSYLKPCFLYFSLLPKDYVFYSFEVIQLWMAQGILYSDSISPEIIGELYFDELSSRGLLEDVEEHGLGYWFKIHSLVHDLAVQLAEKEQENLGILHHDGSSKAFSPSKSGKIHCLSVPVGDEEPKINGVPLVKCISKFRELRFLYLCNSSLEEIPTSIGTLNHLRYLDLRGNCIIKRLPESICKLDNLQTLILAFCTELEELPKDIKNLINLRLLWITTKQARLGKDGIGSLTSLYFLAIGGSQNLTHLFEDIEKLSSLKTLIIYDCKSLLTLPQGLQNLSGLRNMAIWGCEQLTFTFSQRKLCLEKLILRGIPPTLPLSSWIDYVEETLEVVEIGELPTLRKLPSWLTDVWKLRLLGISNCPRLERMPDDMSYLCDLVKELRITFCGSLSNLSKERREHKKLGISHIPTIYVDSRRIKKRQHKDEDNGEDDNDKDNDEDDNEDNDEDDDEDNDEDDDEDNDNGNDKVSDKDHGGDGGKVDGDHVGATEEGNGGDGGKVDGDHVGATGEGNGGDGGKVDGGHVAATEEGDGGVSVKLDGVSDNGNAMVCLCDSGQGGDGETTVVVTRQGF